MRIIISVLFSVLTCIGLSADTLDGIVRGKGDAGLGYATVLLKGRQTGVLADSTGHFSLPADRARPNDSIVVGYVGFKPQTVALADLDLASGNNVITLEESTTALPELTVRPRKYKKQRHGKKHHTGMMKASLDVGNIAGETYGFEFHSKPGRALWLDNVGFYIEESDDMMKRMKFRVNIYDMSRVTGDISDKFDNILPAPLTFEYRNEDVRDGTYTYRLPEMIRLPENAMVEIEALENREGEAFAYRCNLLGKGSWSKTLEGDGLWIKSTFAMPFFAECIETEE